MAKLLCLIVRWAIATKVPGHRMQGNVHSAAQAKRSKENTWPLWSGIGTSAKTMPARIAFEEAADWIPSPASMFGRTLAAVL